MLRLVREPLAQFFVLGALIFVAAGYFEHASDQADRRIVVTEATVERLAQRYRAEMGFPATEQQLKALVDAYVRDEALYREAVRLHLDDQDEIIRRRLVQKMQFLVSDVSLDGSPSRAVLRGYYAAHPERFTNPPAVAFHHIYFSPDHGGSEQARRRAEQAEGPLARGADWRTLGDEFPLQARYGDLARQDMIQLFGDTPMVHALFIVPVRRWSGPFRSGYGWHLVFVDKRRAPTIPPFETIQDRVRGSYLDDARAKAAQDAQRRLLARYDVRLPARLRP